MSFDFGFKQRKTTMSGWLTVAGMVLLSPLALHAQAPAAASDATPASAPASVATPAPAVSAPRAGQAAAAGGTKVHGTITDPDGDLIPGAAVQLTSPKGSVIKATSGSDGTYTLSLPPGSYNLLVTMPGFSPYSSLGVRIPAVASTTLDAKMQVGTQEQVVTVSADSIQLSVDPENNASSTILTGKDLEALSDDPDELSSELTALAGPSTGPNGGQIYVDGFTGGQLPPKSSIREIRINSNPFSAQYDKLGYGRIEVFTKPGTDKLHGNIQVNGNPSQLNSSNPLETGFQPPYHTLFMFGNLTGPLSKKASYNFGGTYRQIQDDSFTNATILAPTATSTTLCDPGTANCVPSTFQTQTYYPQRRAEINPRLDLALGSKNVLTTRYQYVNNKSTNAGIGNLTLPTAGDDTQALSNILQMSDSENFSARLVNEIHFEYEREHVNTTPLSTQPTVTLTGNFTSGGYAQQSLSDHQDHIEVQNYTSLQLKKNFIRMGGRLRVTREAQNTAENSNGQFIYSTQQTYLAGTPNQFALTVVNNHDIGDTYADLGMYAETDWKVKPNLTVSYGFRYETQNHIADHHDFAPRTSFNYGLFSKHGAPKTVVRGGFGLFYDRFSQGNILNLQQENGTNEMVYTVNGTLSSSCKPSVGTAGYVTSTGTLYGANAFIAACGATQKTQTVYQMAPTLRTPYVVQFAIGADQQLSKTATISVNYLHAQGVHQLATQNINYPQTPTVGTPPASALPYPTQGPIYQYFTEGVFHQNQLILNGRIQTSKRVSLSGYVSLNSAKGDTSGAGSFVTTPFHIANDYGRTQFDVRARYFISGSITLPHFILLSPFVIGQTGNPYNITAGTDINGDTIYNDRPYLVPNSTPKPISPGTISPVQTIPGCGTFAEQNFQPAGSSIVPINYCTGPALFAFNMRITKTWGFGNKASAPDGGRQRGGGAPGGGGFPGGGPPGGGGGGGGSRGGGGGFGGGGTNTGKKYNFGLGVQLQNLFANENLATPIGTLSSPKFGQSTQITGAPYTTSSALRRIQLNASFTF